MSIAKGVPMGLVGMLGLIGLVEAGLGRHEVDFKTGWHWEWTVNGRASKRRAADFPVLCFGDSQVNHGIIPAVLEGKTGHKTLNLALSGGQTTTSYFQLRRAIEAGAKPRAVVVDFFPLLLNHGYEENTARWHDLLSPRECLELAKAVGDPTFVARVVLGKMFVSYRERDGIRKGVVHAVKGVNYTERHEAAAQWRNWALNNGGLVFDRNPGINLGDLDVWYKAAFSNKDWIARYHATYLKKFLDLAKSHDLAVYWVVPPLPPQVQAKFTERGQDGKFERLASGVLTRYPNVTVLDARRAGYPTGVFVDHGHLDRVGARTFTADVGEALARIETGPRPGPDARDRWVTLPGFRPLAEEPPIEDIGQSRRIVAEAVARTVR